MSQAGGRIRVGIGGWTYEPWRGTFYPEKLAQKNELAHAAAHVTAIEINGTFYGRQKPESFEKWARETPDDFLFSLKASRYCTNRRVLGEAGESITRFLEQGIVRLEHKLGPILWQFAATKQFDAEDFTAFVDLLPEKFEDRPLRHALEVRHESFRDPRFIDLARDRNMAIVFADSQTHPTIADQTADFVYARLQDARADEPTGYPAAEIKRWAGIARDWAAGGDPLAEQRVSPAKGPAGTRYVLVFFINGAKVRAPAAAQAMIAALG